MTGPVFPFRFPPPPPESSTDQPPHGGESILAMVDANVDLYVTMLENNPGEWTTPQLMLLALQASERRPDTLALLFATTLQKLATERWSTRH